MTPIEQQRTELTIDVAGPTLLDLTAKVSAWLEAIRARDGLLTIFLRNTSASLTIQENADPKVRADLIDALGRLDGPGDMPAHIKAMLTSVSLSIPVFERVMALGPSQVLFLIEHRQRKTPRTVLLHYIGSCS
jgi:secondary thiamine-phosphate synthase enzyme